MTLNSPLWPVAVLLGSAALDGHTAFSHWLHRFPGKAVTVSGDRYHADHSSMVFPWAHLEVHMAAAVLAVLWLSGPWQRYPLSPRPRASHLLQLLGALVSTAHGPVWSQQAAVWLQETLTSSSEDDTGGPCSGCWPHTWGPASISQEGADFLREHGEELFLLPGSWQRIWDPPAELHPAGTTSLYPL